MYYDMHVHSTFSTDSTLDMEAGILKAIELGLSGIAFTDHLDIDFTGFEDEFHYDFNEYFSKINLFKDKYNSKLDIISAVEIGFQPHVISDTAQMLKGFNFDYTIGSTHLIKKKDPYYKEFFYDKPNKQFLYQEYLEELYNNLILFRDFSINTMGHLDYIIRYAPYDDPTMYYINHSDIIDSIFNYIIANDIAFEINTSSYKNVNFDINILKRYKELGGKLITFGSDSHSVEFIGHNFIKYAELLKSEGFNSICFFKSGIPYFINI